MRVPYTLPETPEAVSPASPSHFPGTFWHTSLPHFGERQVLRRLVWLGAPARAWWPDRPGMVQPLPSPTCLPPKERSTWTPLERHP